DIWYRRLHGDTTARPLVSGPASEVAPRISPDGKWLAYSSDESGSYQVYVTPIPGPGGRLQISQGIGVMPVWSHDGRRLFYISYSQLMEANLVFSPDVRVQSRRKLLDDVSRGPPTHASYDVAPDGKHFLFLKNAGDDEQLI